MTFLQFPTFGQISTEALYIRARALCRLGRSLIILTIRHSRRRYQDFTSVLGTIFRAVITVTISLARGTLATSSQNALGESG